MADLHEPVLLEEVVTLMRDAETVVDMTLGAGGHSEALLRAGVRMVIGVDRDPDALDAARARLAPYADRFRAVQTRFSQVGTIAAEAAVRTVDGILYDLGASSLHLDRPERGFSYRGEGPLDMRMGGEGLTAAEIVNTYDREDLERILREYGEERFAGRIARAIERRRPFRTTTELAAVVAGAVPRRRVGPHPARRTFQALRIEVNRELEELADSLPRSVELLSPGGTLVVISYHSLEDRIVKRFILAEERLETITRRPTVPSDGEIDRNPRARSAKLRAASKRQAA